MAGKFNNHHRKPDKGYKTNDKPKQNTTKKSHEDYIFDIAAPTKAAEYDETKKFLIVYIQEKLGNDVATALETGQPYDFKKHEPKWSPSKVEDEEERKIQDNLSMQKWKMAYSKFLTRQETYEENMFKAYSIIWSHCSKILQSKIETLGVFTTTIKNDPIQLLKTIKEQAFNFQDTRYDMSIISATLKAFLYIRQEPDESELEYATRFEATSKLLQTHLGGPLIINKLVTKAPEFDAGNDETMIPSAMKTFQRFEAYRFLEGCDRTKYGSLLKHLETQMSLKDDQYPKNMEDAVKLLSTRSYDRAYHQNKNRSANNNNDGETNEEQKTENVPSLTFAQMQNTWKSKCWCCGETGHFADKCSEKDSKPQGEWAIHKILPKEKKTEEQSHHNHENNPTPPSLPANLPIPSTTSNSISGWACFQAKEYNDEMKDVIMMDTATDAHMFSNEELVIDIRKADKTLMQETNAGRVVTDLEATVPGLGTVWFNPDGKTNVFCHAKLEEKYSIDYDKNNKAFIVHLDDGKRAEFKNRGNGLYYYKPTEKYKAYIAECKRLAGVEEPKSERLAGVNETKAESEPDLDNFPGVESTQATMQSEDKDVIAEDQSGEWILVQRKKKIRIKLVQRKKKTRNKFKSKPKGHGLVCPIDRPK